MRRLFLIFFTLIGVLGVHAQESVDSESDSLYIYTDLFFKYIQEDDTEKAIVYGNKLKREMDSYGLSDNTAYCSTIEALADLYYLTGNVDKTLSLLNELRPKKKEVCGESSLDYYKFLNKLSGCYSDLENYTEAVRLGAEAVKILGEVLGTEHPNYATSLSNLANDYSFLDNYSEAFRIETEALNIRKKVLGPEHPDYVESLVNISFYHFSLGNYTEAIRFGTEAKEIQKKLLGENHPDYAQSLSNLGTGYAALGNYPEAIRLETEAMDIYKNVFGTDHSAYVQSFNLLAGYYSALGNYPEAIRLTKDAVEIVKKVLGPDDLNYATYLANLSHYYSSYGDFSEAIRLGSEALDIKKKILGSDDSDYAISLNNLAACYLHLGNYPEAIRLGTEALEIQKKILGPEHVDYATSLSSLASCYSSLGDYHEAIRLEKKALEIRRNALGIEHPLYSVSLNNLSICYSALGNYTEAIQLEKQALEIQEKAYGLNRPDYVQILSNLIFFHSNLGNYTEAISLGKEAQKTHKDVLEIAHPACSQFFNNFANCYASVGNYSEAIRLSTEAKEIQRNVLGPDHPDYAISLENLAYYSYFFGNFADYYSFFDQSLHSSQKHILSSFSSLSSRLQEALWTNSTAYSFYSGFPSAVFKFRTNESISELYDLTALFAKGILLNTGIEIRKLILESGDMSLVARYDALASDRSIYDKQLEKPISDRTIDMDSLRSVIDRKEMKLARDSKAYGDFSRNLRITWRDVQEKLDDDELAVEFLDFPMYGTDSTMYVALTLRKDYDFPCMIPLFEKGQLDSVSEGSLYTDTSLYDLVWKPLESELSGVKAIYFSPSGELHRIGIEYVPVTPTENICDRYNLHRLSSTRQLAVVRDGIEGEGGVLYGGLDYNGVTDKGPTVTEGGNGTRSYRYIPRANVDSLDLRGSLSYLPSTKEEVERIVLDMKRNNVPCMSYTGKTGTEESFKQLEGTRPRILHIATHGFYFTEEAAEEKHFVRPILQEGEASYREDKPMTRSGLLLSGCRPALNHETIPEGDEDGILTAQEISQLDLRGLDLVVLSACQTGLGDIVSGEGVFGLQRGFKNAGARTIVMSLWKVDDNATLDLMVSFYEHYLGGKTKEESFRLAREELRRKSQPGKIRPDWAAFVILDGE
jgi:tetratricopeptide (TPR) repeat protein/CHAT domain-containing protein